MKKKNWYDIFEMGFNDLSVFRVTLKPHIIPIIVIIKEFVLVN